MSDRSPIIQLPGPVCEIVRFWQILLAHGPLQESGLSTGHDITRKYHRFVRRIGAIVQNPPIRHQNPQSPQISPGINSSIPNPKSKI